MASGGQQKNKKTEHQPERTGLPSVNELSPFFSFPVNGILIPEKKNVRSFYLDKFL